MSKNQQAQKHISDKVKAAFAQMDKDRDGQVTFREFCDYCKKTIGCEGLAEAFCEIDTSGDQKITLEELNDLCNKVSADKINECHIKDLFRELDRSGDGKLDKNEFRVLMSRCRYSDAQIDETFNYIAQGDGQITLDEFLHAFRQCKK